MAKKVIEKRIVQGKEFSKKIVIFSAVCFLGCIITSYVLAWFGRDPVGELSIALSASFTGVVASYLAKSYKEKDSRNRHKVDEFGNFIGTESEVQDGKDEN